MELSNTPLAERVHIGFFGLRNAGKSSLVNAVANQQVSVVSNVKGTTTDPVKKTMELLPLGAVVLIDTAGVDDIGEVGKKRVEAAESILRKCNIAVLVTEAGRQLNTKENLLLKCFKEKNLPYIIVKNKADLTNKVYENTENTIYVSAKSGMGIEEFKNALGSFALQKKDKHFVSDLVNQGDFVILVTPIDGSAPKGRLILPQQMAVRDILDKNAVPILTQPSELESVLSELAGKTKLVITDSQVFSFVNKLVPKAINLTSFSVLMARYKGFLATAVQGANVIDSLKNNAKILISEGCTHHRQCEDIGTVKLPKLLEKYTGKSFNYQWSSGAGFPKDLSEFDLIIHCGGCMLNEKEMEFRRTQAEAQNVPFTNYGTAIAYINGLLERSLKPLQGIVL